MKALSSDDQYFDSSSSSLSCFSSLSFSSTLALLEFKPQSYETYPTMDGMVVTVRFEVCLHSNQNRQFKAQFLQAILQQALETALIDTVYGASESSPYGGETCLSLRSMAYYLNRTYYSFSLPQFQPLEIETSFSLCIHFQSIYFASMRLPFPWQVQL